MEEEEGKLIRRLNFSRIQVFLKPRCLLNHLTSTCDCFSVLLPTSYFIIPLPDTFWRYRFVNNNYGRDICFPEGSLGGIFRVRLSVTCLSSASPHPGWHWRLHGVGPRSVGQCLFTEGPPRAEGCQSFHPC